MKLQERLPDGVMVHGRKIKLDFDFRNVLRMMEILGDDKLMPEARDYLAVKCLTKHPRYVSETLEAVRKTLFEERPDRSEKKVTSFEQDAGMIRTAFRQEYGIDLFRERLHWLEFSELLSNLPEGSRYAEVIGIRVRPIPAPTKYNQKERESLIKAKAAVALHMTDEEQEKFYDNAVSRVFAGLLKIAERGENHE